MDKAALHETIGKAIRAASGKPFAEAQRLITEAAWSLVGTEPADTFAIAPDEPAPPDTPPPSVIQKPTTRITELRAVKAPPRSVVRQQHSTEYIQDRIVQNMPEVLVFVPENTDKEAHLNRVITVSTEKPPSVQISYRPNDNDPNIPYPKKMLFSTDDESDWDFPAMLAKMTQDAASMYRRRTQPIVTRTVRMGDRIIIGTRDEA